MYLLPPSEAPVDRLRSPWQAFSALTAKGEAAASMRAAAAPERGGEGAPGRMFDRPLT
jgi:hypothetical protein